MPVMGILPFLKIDRWMDEVRDGVQTMREIHALDALVHRSAERGVFGTKVLDASIESIFRASIA